MPWIPLKRYLRKLYDWIYCMAKDTQRNTITLVITWIWYHFNPECQQYLNLWLFYHKLSIRENNYNDTYFLKLWFQTFKLSQTPWTWSTRCCRCSTGTSGQSSNGSCGKRRGCVNSRGSVTENRPEQPDHVELVSALSSSSLLSMLVLIK